MNFDNSRIIIKLKSLESSGPFTIYFIPVLTIGSRSLVDLKCIVLNKRFIKLRRNDLKYVGLQIYNVIFAENC